jgi:hypothetical protein
MLLPLAQDQPGLCFFEEIRKKFNLLGFVAGVISSGEDQGTGETLLNPTVMENLSFADLQNLKDPFGRAYLAIASSIGTCWGIS